MRRGQFTDTVCFVCVGFFPNFIFCQLGFRLISKISPLVPGGFKILPGLVQLSVDVVFVVADLYEALAQFPAQDLQAGVPGPLLSLFPFGGGIKSRVSPDRSGGRSLGDIYVRQEPSRDHWTDADDVQHPPSHDLTGSEGG